MNDNQFVVPVRSCAIIEGRITPISDPLWDEEEFQFGKLVAKMEMEAAACYE